MMNWFIYMLNHFTPTCISFCLSFISCIIDGFEIIKFLVCQDQEKQSCEKVHDFSIVR